jgi:hypothetical protein
MGDNLNQCRAAEQPVHGAAACRRRIGDVFQAQGVPIELQGRCAVADDNADVDGVFAQFDGHDGVS